nr:hypothetical protein [Tanacetum cinerariifolium]
MANVVVNLKDQKKGSQAGTSQCIPMFKAYELSKTLRKKKRKFVFRLIEEGLFVVSVSTTNREEEGLFLYRSLPRKKKAVLLSLRQQPPETTRGCGVLFSVSTSTRKQEGCVVNNKGGNKQDVEEERDVEEVLVKQAMTRVDSNAMNVVNMVI